MEHRTLPAVLAAIAALSVGAGCSGPGAEETQNGTGQVATLQSTGPTPSAGPSGAPERPLLRADASDAERNALNNAYWRCVKEAGGPVAVRPDGNLDRVNGGEVNSDKAVAAYEACASKRPEGWYEREQRVNPEFVDRLRDAVKCLKGKGHQARVDGDPPQLKYPSAGELMAAGDDEADCVREAFQKRIDELYRAK